MRYLNRCVRDELSKACEKKEEVWKDLGRELMGDESEAALSSIAVNKKYDVTTRCSSLFSLWLERQPEATWKQLIDALNQIKLSNLATEIKKKLIPSEDIQLPQTSKSNQLNR